MKTNNRNALNASQEISQALTEVWEWKEAVYKEVEQMTAPQRCQYFQESLQDAAQLLHAQLRQNADGSYCLVR